MESYIIIIMIFGGLSCFLLVLLAFLNRIILYRNKIERSFDTVREHLLERRDLFLLVVNFIRDNLEHEEVLSKKIGGMNELFSKSISCYEGIELLKKTDKIFLEIKNLVEVYPELKKNQEYNRILDDYVVNQDRISYAMDSYNKGVSDYNQLQENKYMNFFVKVFRFPEYKYYN